MSEAGQAEASTRKGAISVFLLDDHEVVRRGVRDLLTAEPDIDVIGRSGDRGRGAGATARLAA